MRYGIDFQDRNPPDALKDRSRARFFSHRKARDEKRPPRAGPRQPPKGGGTFLSRFGMGQRRPFKAGRDALRPQGGGTFLSRIRKRNPMPRTRRSRTAAPKEEGHSCPDLAGAKSDRRAALAAAPSGKAHPPPASAAVSQTTVNGAPRPQRLPATANARGARSTPPCASPRG